MTATLIPPPPRVLCTPEQTQSTACAVLRAPGNLFIQACDAYGYQRELTLIGQPDGSFELHVYQHPGRREKLSLGRAIGRKIMAALIARCDCADTWLLFGADMPRNRGFVAFQEAAFRGADSKDLLAML